MAFSTASRCSISRRRTDGRNKSSEKKPDFLWAWRASRRFCSSVACSNSSMFWKVRAMPSAAMRCGATLVMSMPSKLRWPAVGS